MTDNLNWLDKQAMSLLHEESLARFGGTRGLIAWNSLEMALSEPKDRLLKRCHRLPDAATLAATYGLGFTRHGPFIAGNQRAALLALGLSLSINGYGLHTNQADLIILMDALALPTTHVPQLAVWLRQHSRRIA